MAPSVDRVKGDPTLPGETAVTVIGGTLLSGGYGSAIGTILGAITFGVIQVGLVLAGEQGGVAVLEHGFEIGEHRRFAVEMVGGVPAGRFDAHHSAATPARANISSPSATSSFAAGPAFAFWRLSNESHTSFH